MSPVGNGFELTSRGFLAEGKYLYTFDETDKNFYQYEMKADGTLREVASILGTPYVTDRAYSRSILEDNTLLVMDPIVWGGPETRWLMIDLPGFTVKASGTVMLPLLNDNPNWGRNLGTAVLHNGKLLMGSVMYDADINFAPGSYAIAFDYPSMENPTLITTDLIDGEMGIINESNYVETENGDLYLKNTGRFWSVPGSNTVHGAILRIKNGETTFDESYFFDLTEAVGPGMNIHQLNYVGNDIAIGIIGDDRDVNGWGDIDGDHYVFAKINLATREVTPYNMKEASLRQAREPYVDEDGMYYSFYKDASANTTHVIRLDPQGGPNDYEIGAQVEGDNVVGLSITKYADF